MAKTIDYYLTPISPYAYLGGERLAEIAGRHGAKVQVKPVDLGVIFPQTGGLPLAKRAPARQAYRLVELTRWSTYLDMPLNLHPKHFPAPDLQAAHLILAAAKAGHDALAVSNALGRAVWAEERDITDADTLKAIADDQGLDGTTLLEAAKDPTVAAEREKLTEEALKLGVFGAPTYVIDGELFWGQDRLDFVERKLAA